MLTARVEALSHDGRGIAHINGKTIFLENALPEEEISFVYTRQRNKFAEAKATAILKASDDRVTPRCSHFNICGGCSLQHLQHAKQIFYKTKTLQEQMLHFGNQHINTFAPPIIGPTWGYRSRARLAVKYVIKKQQVLVGFHEKNGRYITATTSCPILQPTVGKNIVTLRELIAQLTIYNQIPQIEIACGDKITAIVLRHLQPFAAKDIELLQSFSTKHGYQIYLQPGNLATIQPLSTPTPLSYQLAQNITMFFAPTNFTQINHNINQQLVHCIGELLAINPTDKILDLFCGIGNFTLPLAASGATVIGIESNKNSIIQAKHNAKYNNINAEFHYADLTQELPNTSWIQQYDKILLDPPRTGANEICAQIRRFKAKHIIYVSCNPTTLARDSKELTNNGYNLQSIRLVDMFPHTNHMEIVAEFTAQNKKFTSS